VRRIGRDVYGFARPHQRPGAAEGGPDLAFQNTERLLKIVPVRRWPASGWNVYIDQAELACRVFSRKKNSIGISHQTDVPDALGVRVRGDEFSGEVVWRKFRRRLVLLIGHSVTS
jgi:hypothetical protein